MVGDAVAEKLANAKKRDYHTIERTKDGDVKYKRVGREKKVLTVAKTITLPYTLFDFVADLAASERLSFSSAVSLLCQRGKAYMVLLEAEEERKCRR